MRAKLLIFLGLMVAAAPAVAQTAGDPAKGRQKAETCVGCHGIPGYRYPGAQAEQSYPGPQMFKVPMVAGQHAAYIVSALQAYKNEQRSNPTMQAQTATLSEQDMQDIAAYFAQAGKSSR